jgi:hypothetical protein
VILVTGRASVIALECRDSLGLAKNRAQRSKQDLKQQHAASMDKKHE